MTSADCAHQQRNVILLADDDEDDYTLVRDALAECCPQAALTWVQDGEKLWDYLLHKNAYRDERASPLPTILLLDLNMPKKNGREVLREIKMHPALNYLPVLCMSETCLREDVHFCYRVGACSYFRKPSDFKSFKQLLHRIHDYWFDCVEVPVF